LNFKKCIKGRAIVDIQIDELKDMKVVPMDLLMLADPSEEMIQEYLPRSMGFAAREADKLVGVLLMMRPRPKTMEIMNISVLETHQNKGIGRQLIGRAVEKARQEKARVLEIYTGNPGTIQMLLYQKCGFRIVGVDLDYCRIHYNEKLMDNGIECRDMIRMKMDL